MALLALRFQLLTQLFRHGLGKFFCHGQINLKPIKFIQIPKRVMKNHGRTMKDMICENIRIWIQQFFVDLDASTKRFSRPPQVQLNYAFDKLPWWSLRTTGSLADASYAERSDWCRTCWPIAAHRQWTRQRSGKVKTTLPGTSCYSGTATQHWSFHGIAYHRIEYMIFDVRLQMEELRVLSKFQWVASFTVPQCHSATCIAVVSQSFQQQRTYLFHLKSNHAATSFVCRLSSSWTWKLLPRRYIMW